MDDTVDPDPEVPERARGPRRYAPRYKARILEEYECCATGWMVMVATGWLVMGGDVMLVSGREVAHGLVGPWARVVSWW
jgi:hypothetical protein